MSDHRDDLACPRCQAVLVARRLLGELVIDECPSCLGLFLDQVAIKQVIADREHADALLDALPKHELQRLVKPGDKMYLPCPICHTMMNRKQFALGAGVIVDVCKQHGTFFDVGELPAIIEFAMHGGLEKAAKREHEQHVEDARKEQQRKQLAAHDNARIEFQTNPRYAGSRAIVEMLLSLLG